VEKINHKELEFSKWQENFCNIFENENQNENDNDEENNISSIFFKVNIYRI
jgi:hypothetical protein